MTKIVILLETLFNERDEERLGIDAFIAQGYEVNVWELAGALYPGLSGRSVSAHSGKNYIRKSFNKNADIRSALKQLDPDCLLICWINYSLRTAFIYRAISRYNLRYCILAINLLYVSYAKPVFILWEKLKNLSFQSLASKIISKLPLRITGVKTADYLLLGSSSFKYRMKFAGSNTHVIAAHGNDYDLYLHSQLKETTQINQAIFLDEYYPFHPDYNVLGMKPLVAAEDYYPELRRFFDYFEAQFNMPILIAAHPRSQYAVGQDYFGTREVVKGRTIEMVAKSRVVLLHSSTSINFAILTKKPMVFLTSNKIRESVQKSSIAGMASYLKNDKLINLSNSDYTVNNVFDYDVDQYNKYCDDYIKVKGSPDAPLWEIFIDSITARQQ